MGLAQQWCRWMIFTLLDQSICVCFNPGLTCHWQSCVLPPSLSSTAAPFEQGVLICFSPRGLRGCVDSRLSSVLHILGTVTVTKARSLFRWEVLPVEMLSQQRMSALLYPLSRLFWSARIVRLLISWLGLFFHISHPFLFRLATLESL